jgi:6-phosphofructokinase
MSDEVVESSGEIQRVGILFSGGPAPGANAVISAAAVSFLEHDREVIGFFHGYSNLQEYHPVTHRLLPDVHYRTFTDAEVRSLRNDRGVRIGTSRANPGADIKSPADLSDAKKTSKLRNVYNALVDLKIDALVSIGGDDTLKTANFLYEYQKRLPPEAKRVRVVHLPKTIDNDYRGIDFTFGFFTAVDVMAKELQNLRADAQATSSYFIVETMGRKAGWLAYGVAIAGEADLVVGVEDVGETVDLHALADQIVDVIVSRERHGEHYGTIVLAEGLAELLPEEMLKGVGRDSHGHISLGRMDLGKMIATVVADRYKARTGRSKKLTGVQVGYEARCAAPHAFDVMLGSQLGIGAYRGLVEQGLDGHMVSIRGQLDLIYVPFKDLVNPETLKTEVRFIEKGSDFHRLARFLERKGTGSGAWSPGPRREG